jgi:hypothetical protein
LTSRRWAGVAPIVVECGQHVLQRDLLAPVGAAATLLASGVGDDRVDPRAERGLASEQVDLPDHTPESVLDRLLGVWGVPGDSEGQTIRASAIRLDEKLGRTGLAPAQRPAETLIAIAAHRRRSRGARIDGVPTAMRGTGNDLCKHFTFSSSAGTTHAMYQAGLRWNRASIRHFRGPAWPHDLDGAPTRSR